MNKKTTIGNLLLSLLKDNPDVIAGLLCPWLEDNEFDGLVNFKARAPDDSTGGCVCDLDNLCWCGHPNFEDCQPAYRWSDDFYRLEKETP